MIQAPSNIGRGLVLVGWTETGNLIRFADPGAPSRHQLVSAVFVFFSSPVGGEMTSVDLQAPSHRTSWLSRRQPFQLLAHADEVVFFLR